MKKVILLKSFIKITMLTIIVGMVFGCDKYIEDSPAPNTCGLYIKFVSPSGTDILDSLYGEAVDYPYYISSNDFSAQCYKNDAFYENIINVTINDYTANHVSTIGDGKIMSGKILCLGWLEWLKNESLNMTYTIKMQSMKIYGDEETHDIKLYLHVKDRNNINVYKIEVDGNEHSYTGLYKNSIASSYDGSFDAYMEIDIPSTYSTLK